VSAAPPHAADSVDLDYGFGPGLATLNELVQLRAEQNPEQPFVTYLADGDRDERRLTYGELQTRALTVAGVLARRGLHPGDRVLVMLPSGLEFIETFFGILLAGMTPVPVYPPARLARLEHYLRTLASITETSECKSIVVDERLIPLVGKRLTFDGRFLLGSAELQAATELGTPFPLQAGSPAFLQFTSGTTSQPRGVLLLQEQVLAQLRSYAEALRIHPAEVVVSWLPLYHDLGLIGKVLACLYAGSHLILLSPIDFLKDPMSWLRAISRYRGVHVAAPNFAYQLCVRKCPPERLRAEGIDLSSVENAGMGGEPVAWSTVERFREHFAPFGFRGETLNPCYGLAENTLVATGYRRGEPLRAAALSLAGLQRNEVCPPVDDADRCTLVGNGRAFPGMRVQIADEAGQDLGAEAIGEIWVQGPSLASGYVGSPESTAATFVERDGSRWLRTGDLGFIRGGDLYICGRQKDLLIVRGRNFHPQDLEQEASRIEGVRVGNVVTFSVDRGAGQGEAAVLVAELDPRVSRQADELRRELAEAISSAFQLALAEVILLPKGSLPKTSSGKLQRGLVKEAYLRGDLAAFVPPGWLSAAWLKLGLASASLGRRLRRRLPGPRPEGTTPIVQGEQAQELDPRFTEAMRSVKPDLQIRLTPALRLDGLGLDSLERVELWLQLERLFAAKVPEADWSALQTLGQLQTLLEERQGTAPATESEGGSSLLLRELLTPLGEQPAPFREPLTAPLAFGFLSRLSRTFWGWRVVGQEHLPPDGSIVAGNHVTYLDGGWLRNAVPPHVRARLIAYNHADLPAFTRVFLAQMDTIPIDPSKSFSHAIRAGIQALEADKTLLIFPEGVRTHSGKMRVFRPGVGLISLLAQKPIVPFRMRGAFEIYPRDRPLPRFVGWRRDRQDHLEIRFGEPLHPPEHDPAQTWSQAQDIVRRLREAVEAL
jgi:1-acyl-sn-glycerol-3-phosphate acyltransferase